MVNVNGHKKVKCPINKCHAACCYNVPLPKGYLSAYSKRIVNKVLELKPYGAEGENLSKEVSDLGKDMCLVVTNYDVAKNKCPFLREDCKCNIYDIRPKICRIFGVTPNVRYLNCEFLSGIPNKIPQSEVEASLAEIKQKGKKIKLITNVSL